jgi:hypothetical protein
MEKIRKSAGELISALIQFHESNEFIVRRSLLDQAEESSREARTDHTRHACAKPACWWQRREAKR